MNHYNLSYTFELVKNFQFTILSNLTLSPHTRRNLQLIIFTVNYYDVYSKIMKLFKKHLDFSLMNVFIQILQTCMFFYGKVSERPLSSSGCEYDDVVGIFF